MIKTIEYVDGVVRMIDQTRLPAEKVFVDCKTIEEVGQAIQTMIIRERRQSVSRRPWCQPWR